MPQSLSKQLVGCGCSMMAIGLIGLACSGVGLVVVIFFLALSGAGNQPAP